MKNEPIELLREIRRHNSSGLTKDMQGRIDAALSQQAEPAPAQTCKCEGLCEQRGLASDEVDATCRAIHGGPAPAQDERKVVETVPRWKFHVLVEHCKKQDQLISDLYARLNSVRLYDEKEVWFWQGDGCDHLESLVCPVVIEADELRRLVNAAPIAPTAPQPEQSGLVEAAKAFADAARKNIYPCPDKPNSLSGKLQALDGAIAAALTAQGTKQ